MSKSSTWENLLRPLLGQAYFSELIQASGGPLAPWTTGRKLFMALAATLRHARLLPEDSTRLLLTHFKDHIIKLGDSWTDGETVSEGVVIVDRVLASVTGSDHFFHLQTGETSERLLHPPVEIVRYELRHVYERFRLRADHSSAQ